MKTPAFILILALGLLLGLPKIVFSAAGPGGAFAQPPSVSRPDSHCAGALPPVDPVRRTVAVIFAFVVVIGLLFATRAVRKPKE